MTRLVSSDSLSRRKRILGYTLLELLIVLAILAALAAMTLPAIRGPLDKSRLRGASRQVQSALAKARFFSIRKGVQVEFRYQVNGSRWLIQTVPSLAASLQEARSQSEINATPSGLSSEESLPAENLAEGELELSDSGFDSLSNSSQILRKGTLPETIRFADSSQDEAGSLPESRDSSLRSPFQTQVDDTLQQTDGLELNEAGERIVWADPIRFLPNGRTEEAMLKLSGPRNFFVDLKIRGLTGAVSYSAPYRVVLQSDAPAQTESEFDAGREFQ